MNFNLLLKQSWENQADRIFLQYEEQSFTHDEMWEISNRLALAYINLGVCKGDTIAIMMRNRPEFLWNWFALSKIGAVAVTLDIRLTVSFLYHQIKNSGCRAIVTESSFLSVLAELENLAELDLQTIIVVPYGPNSQETPISGIKIYQYSELLQTEPINQSLIEFGLPEDWPLTIVYTSGTTGPAKGVVNPHGAFVLSGIDIGAAAAMNQQDRLFLFLPLFHANPQLMGIPAVLQYGASLVIGRKFSASSFWAQINRHEVTLFTYVGTVLTILDKISPERVRSTLRAAYGGGAPEQVWRSLERKGGFQILEGYGMAEIGGLAVLNSVEDKKIGSIGKKRDAFAVRIFNEYEREAECGEIGEIVVRPNVPNSMFTHYINMEKATLSAMRNLWFHTGDLAWRDAEGYFYFAGRKKNLIRKNGENISGYEIENLVFQHEKILEAAVVPVPDEIAGEEIKLCVVPKSRMSVTYGELEEWLVAQLPVHMIPRYLNIRESFVKTSSEKIQIQTVIDEGVHQVWDRKQKVYVE